MAEKVADIRAELVQLGLTVKEANDIKGAKALKAKRAELQASQISYDVEPEEEYEVSYEEDDYPEHVAQSYPEEEYEVSYEEDDDEDGYTVTYDEEEDDFPEAVEKIEREIVDGANIPLGSPEWQELVMSMFREDELIPNPDNKDQKVPCLSGLSRVGNEIYHVISSEAVEIIPNVIDNWPAATVRYSITAENNDKIVTYSAVADAWIKNMDPQKPDSVYNRYPTAIAESRAESRVWKKLLHIRHLPSYEEISKTGEASNTSFFDEAVEEDPLFIKDGQKNIITQKCKQFGIDLYKLINKPHFVNPEENPEILFDNIDELPYNTACKIVKELSLYQTATEEAKEIPEEILIK